MKILSHTNAYILMEMHPIYIKIKTNLYVVGMDYYRMLFIYHLYFWKIHFLMEIGLVEKIQNGVKDQVLNYKKHLINLI